MKINANSIRAGNVLEYNGKLWVVACTPEHTMPGKGGAFVQVEMKEIVKGGAKGGAKLNERFRSEDSVEKVRLDQKEYQYLFREDNAITLMDNETYEQIMIDASLFGDAIVFLQDGMTVTLESYDESPIQVHLPETVILEIVEAEPVIKGQTATSSYKPAMLSNGVRIMVPPFIDAGIKVVVRTADASYVERAKS